MTCNVPCHDLRNETRYKQRKTTQNHKKKQHNKPQRNGHTVRKSSKFEPQSHSTTQKRHSTPQQLNIPNDNQTNINNHNHTKQQQQQQQQDKEHQQRQSAQQ